MNKGLKIQLIYFIKQEIVLVAAGILAIISCFFTPISSDYLNYIDFRVLALLFCLMIVVAGFKYVNFFYILSNTLFKYVKNIRSASAVFILLCFVSSMIITNDVALILFVPLTIFSLKSHLSDKQLIFLIILETIASNLGSMFTPIGNPQNLYLYMAYNMDLIDFFKTMAPYTLCSLAVLIICISFIPPKELTVTSTSLTNCKKINYSLHYVCYTFLFILALTTVARITPYQVVLTITIITIALVNRRLFLNVDYYLLLTFIAFFIFVGNMGKIEYVRELITGFTKGNELISGVVTSQFISNVPATLLLSNFTDDTSRLLIGVNLGGLGTIIASMASLISYKFYAKEKGSNIALYFLYFTLLNVTFLIPLLLISQLNI